MLAPLATGPAAPGSCATRTLDYNGVTLTHPSEESRAPETQDESSAARKFIYQAKRQWEMTVDAIKDPLILIDEHYTIVRANRAVASLNSGDVRTVPGKRCHEVLFSREEICEGCPVAACLSAGARMHSEVRSEDGEQIFQMGAFPMIEDDQTRRIVCTYRDVTHERQLTRRLIQAEKMGAVGQLAGGVAHEINNPLGGILAFTQLMKRDFDESDGHYAYLEEIEQSALRCKRIVDNLLNFSRQPREDEQRPVDLNAPIRDALFLLHYRVKHETTQIKEELQEPLPRVMGNGNQLQQIFVNLITNALDATAEGEGRGEITVRTSTDHRGRVVAAISDNGCGIPDKDLNRVLEPFFTTKEEGKGTGLGLAICYRIIEDHGGSIELKSKEGVGTTFTLRFPASTLS